MSLISLASPIRRLTGLLRRSARPRRPAPAEPLDPSIQVPRHLVIIPDGNRRWARARGVPEADGHRRGAEVVEQMIWRCREWGVSVLTFWGFSTENWDRSDSEVRYLMELMTDLLKRNVRELEQNEVRFRHLGRRDRLPDHLRNAIDEAERRTNRFSAYNFNLCLDYGGRDEIVRAVRRIIEEGLQPEQVTERTLSDHLDTAGLPDPDLIVRTSGELRLSGVLPYQSVYAEFAFVREYFPDMTTDILRRLFEDYSQRERRFGR